MTVCGSCSKNLFDTRWAPGQEKREHPTSLEEWKVSVRNACTICTLLFENFKAAVQSAQAGSPKPWVKPTEKELQKLYENDKHIRESSGEDILLEWADANADLSEISFPVYEVTIQDAGGREAWFLKFQPSQNLAIHSKKLPLLKQRFYVYAAGYDGGVQTNRALEKNTKPEMTFGQVDKWIRACETGEHPRCAKVNKKRLWNSWVPTRLIDTQADCEPCHLRLVETGNKAGTADGGVVYDRYVTLSYKWGYDPAYLLKDENLSEFKSQMQLELMPQTFQDAVTATRALGIRYLWIDALCMLQQNADEFLREAPLMQEVYDGSYVSLAAVSADNSMQGLFRERAPTGAPPSVATVKWNRVETQCVVIREDFWRGEILTEPLYVRGWVLQERLLAPRILHFQRRQIMWQCPSLTACEAVPQGLSTVVEDERKDEKRWRQLLHRAGFSQSQVSNDDEPTDQHESVLSSDDKADLQEIWRLAVTSYTTCNLTKNRDKLMAISGIAKKMKPQFLIQDGDTQRSEHYYAGLWEGRVAEQLAWEITEYRAPKDELAYRGPSWSWASADGVVRTPVRINHEREYTMKIEPGGVHVQLEKHDVPCGTVLFASLTAEVQLFHPLTFQARRQDSLQWEWTGFEGAQHSWCRLSLDRPLTVDGPVDGEDVALSFDHDTNMHRVVCRAAMVAYSRDLDSASHSGFALALRSIRAGPARIFRRLGIIQFRNLVDEVGQGWRILQGTKKVEAEQAGEVAPSDDRAKDRYIITLL